MTELPIHFSEKNSACREALVFSSESSRVFSSEQKASTPANSIFFCASLFSTKLNTQTRRQKRGNETKARPPSTAVHQRSFFFRLLQKPS
jgi:hypothetical protein